MRRTEKDRILAVISKAGIELTTATIARLAGILHPSTRRCLNELRADGYAQRGQTRGTWIYTTEDVRSAATRLLTDITPGDWTVVERYMPEDSRDREDLEHIVVMGRPTLGGEDSTVLTKPNADFIAAAPRLVRDLLTLVADLSQQIARQKEQIDLLFGTVAFANAEIARYQQQIAQQERTITQLQAILDSVHAVMDGEPVNDFMLSFGTVRDVVNLVVAKRTLEVTLAQQAQELEAAHTERDSAVRQFQAVERECQLLAALGDPPGGAWQPIDSAPKNRNTPVLLWIPGYGVGIGDWLPISQMWCYSDRYEDEPTHWMPLPAAPAPDKEKK